MTPKPCPMFLKEYPKPRLALITGASSGLGKEFATQLAQKGFNLILVARREELLREIGENLQNTYHVTVEVVKTDLSIPEDIQKVIDRINNCEDFRLLINNAGFGIVGHFQENQLSKYEEMLKVHNLTPLILMHTAITKWTHTNTAGSIINVASLAGLIPTVTAPLYGPTKQFLITLSKSLQTELNHTSEIPIHIQALCPGFVFTQFHDVRDYINETNFRKTIPSFMWMQGQEVVSYSLRKLNSQKIVVIPGSSNRWLYRFSKIPILPNLIKFLFRKRLGKYYT